MCKEGINFAQNLLNCAVDKTKSLNSYIENSIVDNWDKDAFTDYKGKTLQFHDVARKIEKLHILFESCGINKGDKIALCGRNSSHWGVAFLATITYGAVAVTIQNEFTSEQIHNIVNHSDARLLFVGDIVATHVQAEAMPDIEGIIYIPDFSLINSRAEQLTYAREHLNEMFGKRYPKFYRKEHVHFYKEEDPEQLAMINYTSGTTGFSKGVMLPYRAIWSNIDHILSVMDGNVKTGSNIVCSLPMAHMYGLAVDFLYGVINGCHLYFLTRLPSPTLIAEAFASVKPRLISLVPLVVEKIIRKKIFPITQTNRMRLLLNTPVVNKRIKQKIREQVMTVFGGEVYEIIVGGAPLNKRIENFLRSIDFPVTIAYGLTETAPLITLSDHTQYLPCSCGTVVKHMEVKVESPDPSNIEGELLTRGMNVMKGYYKNEEATAKVIDEHGWLHTGDSATISEDGHIYIKGRIKNMLLGANGQNVYPEEIEDKLNSMPMVGECLLVQRGDKLVALVYPDVEETSEIGLDENDIENVMEQNRLSINETLPSFSRISRIEIQKEEFKKTPKKSIKRYLYKESALAQNE